MEQNQVQQDLSAFRDPFRYNTFHGFNSHNHIVVTEVGEGTSVVEVEMTQKGGKAFLRCCIAAIARRASNWELQSGREILLRRSGYRWLHPVFRGRW